MGVLVGVSVTLAVSVALISTRGPQAASKRPNKPTARNVNSSFFIIFINIVSLNYKDL